MPQVARTVGGPGAGKTTRALEIMAMCLKQTVMDPLRLGFVSFTRAARSEAATRAGERFGIKSSDLEKYGFFRTLHSIAYRQLKVAQGELIVGGKDDTEWLRNSLNDERATISGADCDDDYLVMPGARGDVATALGMWDHARSRQIPLEFVWRLHQETNDRLPDLGDCQGIVSLYEAAKRSDGRLDFCDLLMKFGGRRWTKDHDCPFEECDPDGEVPVLPVWLHDEAQDMSALTAIVFQRLIQASNYAYLFGDDYQAIYGWAGSDGRIFSGWPVAKEEMLPLSHRCPEAILRFGSGLMPDRPFNASRPGGAVDRMGLEEALASIEPGTDTLVLARTNDYARAAARFLDDRAIPWRPTKGGGGFAAPARAQGVGALHRLRQGEKIGGDDFWRLIDLLPSKVNGEALFHHGTKKWFDDREHRAALLPCGLADSEDVGCTDSFRSLMTSGKIADLLEPAAQTMLRAATVHGVAAIGNPTVRVGTAHSAKGQQAAHVVCINRIPWPTERQIQSQEGLEEERRVWYVSSTRASERLTIAETDGTPFEEL